MADRVSASITIGGALPVSLFPDLLAVIASEGLATDWDGSPFTERDLPTDEPLALMAHEVAWGRFEELEAFCQAHALPFARWSGAYSGEWSAERVVFTGVGDAASYIADDEDQILVCQATVDRLGSYDALRDHFAKADFAIPPLLVMPEGVGPRELAER